MRVSTNADGRAARLGDAAGFAAFAFFDVRLATMANSVRNEATRRQGDDEHRLQTGPTS
jgi:hypothetical protein